MELHGYDPTTIRVAGAPQFDRTSAAAARPSRDEFFRAHRRRSVAAS